MEVVREAAGMYAAAGARIAGTGGHLPGRPVGNDEVVRLLPDGVTDAGWIAEHTGIEHRHWAAPGEATSDLAAAAGRLALEAARQHGASGQGQAIIFANGRTVAAETKAGTDAMLKGVDPLAAKGGLLVKSMAPGQLVSMDPPAIGCHTVELAAAAGLAGILVEAGHSVIVQPQAVKAAADAAGLFVYGMSEP